MVVKYDSQDSRTYVNDSIALKVRKVYQFDDEHSCCKQCWPTLFTSTVFAQEIAVLVLFSRAALQVSMMSHFPISAEKSAKQGTNEREYKVVSQLRHMSDVNLTAAGQ